jgi:hypothetical protein
MPDKDHHLLVQLDFSTLGGEGLLKLLRGSSWSISQKLLLAGYLWKEEEKLWIPRKQKILHEWIRSTLLKSLEKPPSNNIEADSKAWFEVAYLHEGCWGFLLETLYYHKEHLKETMVSVNMTPLTPCFTGFFKTWLDVNHKLLEFHRGELINLFKSVVKCLNFLLSSLGEVFKPSLEALVPVVQSVLLIACRRSDLDLGEEYKETLMIILNSILHKWNTDVKHYKNTKKVQHHHDQFDTEISIFSFFFRCFYP